MDGKSVVTRQEEEVLLYYKLLLSINIRIKHLFPCQEIVLKTAVQSLAYYHHFI